MQIRKWLGLTGSTLVFNAALADHGPGTSGGGVGTPSGETMKPGKFSISVREDFTEFQDLSEGAVTRKATRAGDIDLLDRSYLTSISLSYGVVENFQVGLSIGYYDAENAREAEFNPATGETEIITFDPDGLTDMWVTAKYRFYHGPMGHFAVFGGVKVPTGKSSVYNSEGERVEPSATAGSGAYDGMLGLAHSRFLTKQLTLDAAAQYTLRGEHDDFRLGDRIDAGVAVAYRIVEDVEATFQPSVFAELNFRHLFKSKEGGERDPNTGGDALFVTPGVRARFGPHLGLTVAAPIPVMQDLNGEQLETDFKLLAELNFEF
ncbi:MAG TPA: transporter [Verrucomicrobiae bacterium]|nr:transporter [Verrucomicrobiae bacterium]